MNRQSILSKTAKGLMEATGKTSDLPRDLRNLLKEIDGKVSVGQLQMRQELFTEAKFMDALRALERDGYVREATPSQDVPIPPRSPASRPPAPDAGGEDLDFTAIASRPPAKPPAYESEEKKKREELDRIHREADERARKAAEEKARREGEAKAKREAEERAKREAEERARREVEEKAKREAEERRRREEDERRRREDEERRRREAEEKAKREAEERRRREEEDRRRREEEERRRREAEEKAKREEEERRRREEEERRRREDEKRRAEEEDERRRKEEDKRRWEIEARAEAAELEQAIRSERAETEERVRRENEERVRREEEERRRQEEEERLRPAEGADAEEEMRRREEEMRRREQEEAARAKQEAKARAEAEAQAAEKARMDARAREKALDEEERRAREQERARTGRRGRGRRARRGLGKPVASATFFIFVIAAVALHFVPIDSSPYEKAAEEWLGQPVRIGTVNVALVPSPHLRFEKITVGKAPQMRIAVARGAFALTSLLDERKTLRRIDIEGSTVPQAFLAALVSGGAAGRGIGVDRVTGKGIKLDVPGFALPELDVDATLDSRGAVTSVRLANDERKLTATLQPQSGRATLELAADKFALPIGANLAVDEFSAKGTIGRNEMALSEFEGRALNGIIQGNARLRWADGWSLEGEFSVKQMDAAKIASQIVAGGKLEGKGVYGMKAAAPDKLFEAARMDGHFTIQKGSITNVDMTRVLQGSSTGGGTTLFSEMSGNASADSGRIQVRQLRMAAGLLQGAGSVDVDSEKNLSGRVQIELRAQTVQARATLAISGSLQNPQFRRTN